MNVDQYRVIQDTLTPLGQECGRCQNLADHVVGPYYRCGLHRHLKVDGVVVVVHILDSCEQFELFVEGEG